MIMPVNVFPLFMLVCYLFEKLTGILVGKEREGHSTAGNGHLAHSEDADSEAPDLVTGTFLLPSMKIKIYVICDGFSLESNHYFWHWQDKKSAGT